MNEKNWSKRIDNESAHRRAGARRNLNYERQNKAIEKMQLVLTFYHVRGLSRKVIGELLNISQATISRYLNYNKRRVFKCSYQVGWSYPPGRYWVKRIKD